MNGFEAVTSAFLAEKLVVFKNLLKHNMGSAKKERGGQFFSSLPINTDWPYEKASDN